MTHLATGYVARQLGTLFQSGSAAGLSDRQLLERYSARRDDAGEAAFAALVARHGPMVLGVCRQLLDDRHHAEDAFQATFLVLARKASSLRDPDLLGNWLYGVALRTARCARLRLARLRQIEETGTMTHPGRGVPIEPTVPPADDAVAAREEAEALHGEIERLPEAFRLPIVLCYLEGLTIHEAARRLRWPHGTVRSRVARAREKLRRALMRRGVGLPAAALDARFASASVSSPLCDTTTRAAIRFAAGPAAGEALAASTAALAQEVLRSMLIHKTRLVALTVLFLGVIATGAGYLTHAPAMNDEPRRIPAGPTTTAAVAARPDDAAPGRMTVVGRVLDPTGKPMAGAPVDVVARPRVTWVPTRPGRASRVLIGQGRTDADGRFRLDAVRTASTRYFEVDAVAAAPGFGLGWARLNPDADQPGIEIRLQPEQTIHGKLVDIQGRPAAGVKIQVEAAIRDNNYITFDGVALGDSESPETLRAWPQPIITDDQGRFTIKGIGRDFTVTFSVNEPRYPHQWIRVPTDAREGTKEVALALTPGIVVEGRVLADDTGQPIAQAIVNHIRADDLGRFTIHQPFNYSRRLLAVPPEGAPYLLRQDEFKLPKGAVKVAHDIRLTRGVVLRGTVTEEGSGRPVAGASVQYLAARRPDSVIDRDRAVVASRDDGSFEIVVLPGKGHLFVFGPTADYILDAIGDRMLYSGRPGGQRQYAHKIIPYDVKRGDRLEGIEAALRPGRTVKGRVVGPEGQTVDDARIIATLHFNYFHIFWRGDLGPHARDGRFELHGLDPDRPVRVAFLDPDHQWGAAVELAGKQAGEDITVRLQPCGRATVRLVGTDGKPIAGTFPQIELLGSPGPRRDTRNPREQAELAADTVYLPSVDPVYHRNRLRTDADGRITLPDLIPGATYRINSSFLYVPTKHDPVYKDFTVKPGETVDLGDITIEKSAG